MTRGQAKAGLPAILGAVAAIALVPVVALAGPPANGVRRAVETGMLWNDNQAKATCPKLCRAPESWTGAWWTTVPERAAACECIAPVAAPAPAPQPQPQFQTQQQPPTPAAVQTKRAVEAGPIWNNDDARGKCPQVCRAPESWNGQWWTTVQGQMSVCECVMTMGVPMPVQAQVVYVQQEPPRTTPPPYGPPPAYGQGQYGQQPQYASPPPAAPPPPMAMNQDDFSRFLGRVKAATFKDAQLSAVSDAVAAGGRWNTRQLIEVMKLLTFGDAQVAAATRMWPSIVDPQNLPDVIASLTFESDRKKLRQALGR